MATATLESARTSAGLREISDSTPEALFRLLGAGPLDRKNRVTRYAMVLLRNSGHLIPHLCDPAQTSLVRARELTRFAAAADATFCNELLQETLRRAPAAVAEERILRVLDLITAEDLPGLNWRLISKLSDTGSQAVRARCLRLIAQRQRGSRMVHIFDSGDARTRADLVEALASTGKLQTGNVLERALADSNNRVAANAALAAYRSGDHKVLPRLAAMIAEDQPETFRLSAAWAMGQTADCRFRAVLTAAMHSSELALRKAAVRAATQLEKLEALPVDSELVLSRGVEVPNSIPPEVEADRTLIVRLSRQEVAVPAPAPPLAYLLFDGKTPVLDYSVEPPPEVPVELRLACPERCLKELMQVLASEEDILLTGVSAFGTTSGNTPGSWYPTATSLSNASRSLLSTAWGARTDKHLLVVIDPNLPVDLNLAIYEKECRRSGVTLHIREFSDDSKEKSHLPGHIPPGSADGFWKGFCRSLVAGTRIFFTGRLAGLSLRLRTGNGQTEELTW